MQFTSHHCNSRVILIESVATQQANVAQLARKRVPRYVKFFLCTSKVISLPPSIPAKTVEPSLCSSEERLQAQQCHAVAVRLQDVANHLVCHGPLDGRPKEPVPQLRGQEGRGMEQRVSGRQRGARASWLGSSGRAHLRSCNRQPPLMLAASTRSRTPTPHHCTPGSGRSA